MNENLDRFGVSNVVVFVKLLKDGNAVEFSHFILAIWDNDDDDDDDLSCEVNWCIWPFALVTTFGFTLILWAWSKIIIKI